jgi:hypothetical protein
VEFDHERHSPVLMNGFEGDALASAVRRRVLAMLLDGTGAETFEAVAARLAAADVATDDADRVELTARDYATLLHHVHVPELVVADLVEWHPESGRLAVAERTRTLAARGLVDEQPSADGFGAD